ncbi:MAG: hypothetical protein M3541_18260 [Acidobacteriota bacterium]|jgi:hypothetical protein|nr:hypothetical protein [Acidobacteriota bacterium]
MARNWVIVRRDRPELFHALSVAFMRRRGYVVVLDRRVTARRGAERNTTPERRNYLADVEPFAIVAGSATRDKGRLN